MDETAAPRRRFKKNYPFLKEEATFIIMKFAEAKSMKKIQWLFRSKFFPKNPRKVPDIWTFYRVIERFKEEGTSHPVILARISHKGDALKMKKVERVKRFFESNCLSKTFLTFLLKILKLGEFFISIGK